MTNEIFGRLGSRANLKTPVSIEPKVIGFKYPVGKTITGGFFAKESGVALIRASLQQLLLTDKGERVMLPSFGTNLRAYLFDPITEETFERMQEEILLAISRYAPNVEVLRLRITQDPEINLEGTHGLNIQLLVREANRADTIIDVPVEIR